MSGALLYIGAFILLVGPLILVHELGHLLVAKAVDVKVTRFCLGFGPVLLRLRLGETEYCLAPVPLGGYVRMLGQDPSEDVPVQESDRALSNKPLWARYAVLAAGPLANFVLPLVIAFFIALGDTEQAPPVIGTVFDDSAASAAELEPGDRILAIDGRDVSSFLEMRELIAESPDAELEFEIERGDRTIKRFITPRRSSEPNALGVLESRGVLGVSQRFYEPQIGLLDPESPAWKAGLRTGDIVTSINGEPVRTIEELEALLELTTDARLRLTYLRPQPVRGQLATYLWLESQHAQLLPRKEADSGFATGMLPANTFVRRVMPGSPAERAGLVAGDRVLAVDGQPVTRWETILTRGVKRRTEPMEFEVHSVDGEPRTVTITQEIRSETDIYKSKHEYLWLGIEWYASSHLPDPEPIRHPFTYAARTATMQTAGTLHLMWTGLRQMVTFERGLEDINSVVYVFHTAGTAAEQGSGEFLRLLAFFSLSIGFVNFLPIPILDGGHLMFFTVEAIRRKPLGQRAREISSAVGLVIILLLFLVALRNDVMKIWME